LYEPEGMCSIPGGVNDPIFITHSEAHLVLNSKYSRRPLLPAVKRQECEYEQTWKYGSGKISCRFMFTTPQCRHNTV